MVMIAPAFALLVLMLAGSLAQGMPHRLPRSLPMFVHV